MLLISFLFSRPGFVDGGWWLLDGMAVTCHSVASVVNKPLFFNFLSKGAFLYIFRTFFDKIKTAGRIRKPSTNTNPLIITLEVDSFNSIYMCFVLYAD